MTDSDFEPRTPEQDRLALEFEALRVLADDAKAKALAAHDRLEALQPLAPDAPPEVAVAHDDLLLRLLGESAAARTAWLEAEQAHQEAGALLLEALRRAAGEDAPGVD
jgi:hypothetical protein